MKQLKILHIIKKSAYDGASVFPVRLIDNLENYDHELLSIYKGSAHTVIREKNIEYQLLLGKRDDSLINKIIAN